tara:strand:- start:29 stop:250 length:222 start_codon:yes stop_codon:yes gene_type:complete
MVFKRLSVFIKKTGCKKTEIICENEGVLFLNVKGKPVEGGANLEIIKFFSRKYGFARIERGFNSKKKLIVVGK